MLQKQICIIIYILLLVCSNVCCDGVAEINIIAYEPRGIFVSIPYEESLKNVTFYGKLNASLDGSEAVQFKLTNFMNYDGKLIVLDENVRLYNGVLRFGLEKNRSIIPGYTGSRKIELVHHPVDIVAYDPEGVRITLRNTKGVEGFIFWANVNTPLVSTKRAIIRLSAFEPKQGAWTAEDQELGLLVNDVVYYTLHIRRNGQLEKYNFLPPLRITRLFSSSLRDGLTTLADVTTGEDRFRVTTEQTVTDTHWSTETVTDLPSESNPSSEYTTEVSDSSPTEVTTTDKPQTKFETTTEEESSSTIFTAEPYPTDVYTTPTTFSTYPTETTTGMSTPYEETSQYSITTSDYKHVATTPASVGFDLKIAGYSPKGLRLSLNPTAKVEGFYFWANINEDIDNRNNAAIKLTGIEENDGLWTATDEDVFTVEGDVLHYIIYIRLGPYKSYFTRGTYVIEEIRSNKKITSTTAIPVQSKPKAKPGATECLHHNVLNTEDVIIDFHSDLKLQTKINSSTLSYIRIDGCQTFYKIDKTGRANNVLKIEIV